MRTGAIFARGSCRALKWLALVGVVFALGAGSAAAQFTVAVPDEVNEGATVTITASGMVSVPASDPGGTLAVSFTGAATSPVPAGLTDAETGDWGTPGTALITIAPNSATNVVTRRVSGTFTWVIGTDLDAESEAVTLTFTQTPTTTGATVTFDPATKDVTIKDSHPQMFEWGPVPTLKEAGSAMITLTANPTPTSGGLSYDTTLAVAGATGYTISPTSHTFSDAAASVTITITAPNNDNNRTDDEIMLRALEAGSVNNRAAPQSITVGDLHKLPEVTAKLTNEDGDEITSAAEGDKVTLTFSVAAAATEAIKIALSEASSSTANMPGDYTLSPMEATIASGDTTSGDVTVALELNDDDLGDEMLVLDGVVTGAAANGTAAGKPVMVRLTVTDSTVKQVFVLPDAMTNLYAARDAAKGSDGVTNPGDGFSVDDDMLFGSADGFTFEVAGRTSDSNIVWINDDYGDNRDAVMIGPNSEGTAMITLTATAIPEMSSFRGTQVSESVARIEFEVEVVATAPVAPSMPQNLRAVPGDGWVMLSWEAPATGDDPTGYEFRSGVDGRWSDWEPTSSMTGHRATGLRNGAEHTFEVRAVAGAVKGQPAVSRPVTPMSATNPAGRITEFSIDGAEEKNIGGKRMHLTEGEHTKISVTIEWTDVELEALWAGGKPAPQRVYIRARRVDVGNPDWLSGAELDHDVNIGPGFHVSVDIPKVPTTSRSAESSGSTQFTVGQDDDAEAEAFTIYVYNAADFDARSKTESGVFVIEDTNPQGIVLTRAKDSPTVAYEGGDDLIYEVTADPERVDLDLDVRFTLEDVTGQTVESRDNWISADDGVVPPRGKASVTVTLDSNDQNRTDDTLKLTAEVVPYALDTGAFDDDTKIKYHRFPVIDVHKLPWLTVAGAMSVMEGDEDGVDLTLTINRNPKNTRAVDPETLEYTSEALRIEVNASGVDSSDYTLSMDPVMVPEYKHSIADPERWMQRVKVNVKADDDGDIGEKMLALEFVVNGTVDNRGLRPSAGDAKPDDHENSMATTTLTIQDATERLVWARTQDEIDTAVSTAMTKAAGTDGLNPGEKIEILGSELFSAAPGIVVDYAAASSDTDIATGSGSDRRMITVTPMAEGMAMVTVTATATSPSGATIVDQTKPNVAQIMFSVDIVLQDLTFSVKGPDDMNLAEGGMGGMVTVTTNRPVTENTEVMLMRDGSSSASEDDYTLEPPLVTIMAGHKMGTTMVMATEDGMPEDMEMLTLFLVVDGMQMTDKSVSFYLWDATVPALPVIAQLLLAALMAVGGYRRYRRR